MQNSRIFACYKALASGLLIILLGCPPVIAAEVSGLYEASVTVLSRDDEQERQQGFRVAMRQMLVKLTGRQDTLAHPAIVRALAAPQAYVETWTYRRLSSPAAALAVPPARLPDPGQDPATAQAPAAQAPTAGPAPAAAQAVPIDTIIMQVTFFQGGIQRLLNDAGIAIWPQNRPETLLWVVIQDELGERYMMGATEDTGGEVLRQVQAAADLRGLPLLRPLMDFTDLRMLRPEQLWNFDLVALRQASLRYQSDSILALRIFRSLSGEIIGKATYMFRDDVKEFDTLDGALEDFVDSSVNLAAEELAGYYSILLSGVDNTTAVLMTVEGIGSVDAYAGLLNYLQGLAAVNGVDVLSVAGNRVELQLRTGGQFRQLVESIALNSTLRPVNDVSRTNNQVLMHYQWQAR